MQLDFFKFDTTEKIIEDLLQSEDFVSSVKIFIDDKIDSKRTAWEKSFTHSFFTREIRNRYSLWYESPLTKNWRENESSRVIIDGIDYSEDHPDNISGKIFDICLERIENAENANQSKV